MPIIDPMHESGQGSPLSGLVHLKTGLPLAVPALFAVCEHTGMRFIEFFTANIRNPITRRENRRHLDRTRLPHLPGDRDYGLSEKRRASGNRAADGRPRIGAHHGPLRPARR